MNSINIKNIILLIGMFVTILFSIVLFWYWASSVVTDFRSVFLTGSDVNLVSQDKLQHMRQELRETSGDRLKISTLAVDEGHLPEFLNKLEGAGGDSVEVVIHGVNKDDERNILGVSMVFTCNISTCIRVLNKVSNIDGATTIDSLELRKDLEFGWVVNLRIVVPFYNPSNGEGNFI